MLVWATILDEIDGELISPFLIPPPPPNNRNRKMVHFGFCVALFLIWGGGGMGVCCVIFNVQGCGSTGSSNNLMIFWLKINMSGSAKEILQNNR